MTRSTTRFAGQPADRPGRPAGQPAGRPTGRPAARPTPCQRLRAFGAPPRIVALDIARGLAVIGMIAAHTLELPEGFAWTDPATWIDIVNGRSAILFALLAGVSVAIITGGTRIPAGDQLVRARLQLAVRGLIIFAIGFALELLGTNIAIILTVYGAVYALAMLFVGLRVRALLLWAAGIAVAGPALLNALWVLAPATSGRTVEYVLRSDYSLAVWTALMLTGLALGRLDVTRRPVAGFALVFGGALSVLGYAVGAMWRPFETGEIPVVDSWGSALAGSLLSSDAHGGGTMEILGSGGLGLALTAALLLAGPRLRYPLLPIAALGALPLTAYSTHIVIIWAVAGPGGDIGGPRLFWPLTIGLAIACAAWALLVGRGPLETGLARAARRLVPREPSDPTLARRPAGS